MTGRRVRALALSVAAVALVVLVGNAAARAGSTDDDAVASALREAVVTTQQSFSSPKAVAAARQLKVGENRAAPALLTAGPSAAEVQTVDAAGRAHLADHFVGAALTDRMRSHDAMIAEQKNHSVPGFTALGGGVSDMQVQSLSVDGDTATVRARLTTWARMSQAAPDGTVVVSQPSNDLLVDATLIRTPGGWLVTTYDWTFAPGSEP